MGVFLQWFVLNSPKVTVQKKWTHTHTHARRTLTMQGQENGVGCLAYFAYFVANFDHVNI
jgi:hypothetical protein